MSWGNGRQARIEPSLIAALGLAGCFIAGPPPGRVIDPEAVGVVAEDVNLPDSAHHIYVLEDGTEIPTARDVVRLGGVGPGEGRLLILARHDRTRYFVSLTRAERMTAAPNCYMLCCAGAWETPDGIVFQWEDDIGIRLPAASGYHPRTDDDHQFILSEEMWCVTPDGVVHAPNE